MRPEEPQSKLYLAWSLIDRANGILFQNRWQKKSSIAATEDVEDPHEAARKYFAEAIQLLNDVILGKWDARFAQVEAIALMDLNRLVNYSYFWGVHYHLLPMIDKRLLSSPLDVDLRVCLSWDTDMTNVELHVGEPTGEVCYSFHNKTRIGGMESRDFTRGYGPIEYVIRNAVAGTYNIQVKLFDSMKMFYGTTVLVQIWTNYGRPGQENCRVFTVRLEKDKEVFPIANVTF